MKTPRLFPLLCTIIALAAGLVIHAADPAPASEPAVTPVPAPKPAPALIDIDFPGGTIAQLAAAIAKSPNAIFNVVGEKAEMEVVLPPFSVRHAQPIALATAINTLLFPRGFSCFSQVGGDGTIFVVSRNNPQQSNGNYAPFISFQLTRYLAHQSVDEIIGAIRAAWELNPEHKPDTLHLKFHPPTNLLLVSGTGECIAIANQVIATLDASPVMSSKSDPKPSAPDNDHK